MNPYISVIVKPTLHCNESCSHCYHTLDERVHGNISMDTVGRLMRLVSEEYQSAWFIWHGGEPLTLPMSFYKDVLGIQEELFGRMNNRVGNTIQTNGTLLNKRLMAYCREKRINIGVSSEGPYNHILRELDPEKAISLLSAKDSKYSVSSTISAETASRQKELYEYFRDRGTNLSLSPVIPAGCARTSGSVPDPDEFIKGSIEAFDAWMHDSSSNIPLIPHYLYILNYLGDPAPSDCAHTSCLTKWISVDPDGTVYPCAKACPDEFRMGNINEVEHISKLFESEGFRRFLIGSIKRRDKCKECPVFRYCNGGCSMDAYHECGIENIGGDSCRIFREVFAHVSSEVQKAIDGQEDVSILNPFVRDAIVGKLINPRIVSQRFPDAVLVVGGLLVHAIVQPVGEEHGRMASPPDDRVLARIVILEIVARNLGVQSSQGVPLVLIGQGLAVVLEMTGYEDLVPLGHHYPYPGLWGGRDDVKMRVGGDVLGQDLGMPGVRHEEALVESSHERLVGAYKALLIDARELGFKMVFLYAVQVVQAGLGAPADVQRGAGMVPGPIHYLAQLVPIVHLLERQVLDWRACDYHTVEIAVPDGIECGVESVKIFVGCVLGRVRGHLKELHIGLQRAVAQASEDLRLGLDLRRHQVHDKYVQRTDVLRLCAGCGHDEDVLGLEDARRREVIRYVDRHPSHPVDPQAHVLLSAVWKDGDDLLRRMLLGFAQRCENIRSGRYTR